MEYPPLPPLFACSNRREIGIEARSLSFSFVGTMTIISVANAIGHFNPRHRVFGWIGKFADHQNSEVPAMLTLSERGELLAQGRGVDAG